MKLYETKTWKLIVNRSHKDCMKHTCICKKELPYRLIKMALELKPEIIAYENQQ